MPTLQIREMPQELYDKLVTSAEKNRRSLTQQAIVLLEEAIEVEIHHKNKLTALEAIKNLRPDFKGITVEDIITSVREDRDR